MVFPDHYSVPQPFEDMTGHIRPDSKPFESPFTRPDLDKLIQEIQTFLEDQEKIINYGGLSPERETQLIKDLFYRLSQVSSLSKIIAIQISEHQYLFNDGKVVDSDRINVGFPFLIPFDFLIKAGAFTSD